MTKKLVGLVASVALLGSGMALANDDKSKGQHDQHSQQQPLGGDAFGGSGSQGQVGGSQQGQVGGSQQGQMGGSQQGQVGGSQDPMGGSQQGQVGGSQDQMANADVGEKQISGTVVKSSNRLLHLRTDNGIIPLKVGRDTQFQDPNVKRVRDLKEGQQVRASFDIQGTDNVAKSITLDTGTGGSMLDDSGINQDQGGSGLGGQDQGGSGLGGQDQGGAGDIGGGDVGGGDVGGGVGGDVGGQGGSGHMGGDTGNKGDKSY
jgi:hypothetical protein